MKVLLLIIIYTIWVLLYASPILALILYYLCYHNGIGFKEVAHKYFPSKKEEPEFASSIPPGKEWGEILVIVVVSISFFSLYWFLSKAFEASFGFLPESWGHYDVELDEYVTAGEDLGSILGTIFSGALYIFMYRALETQIELRKLEDKKSRNRESNYT